MSGPSQNGDSLPVEGLDLGLEAAFAGEESVLARLAPDGVSAVPIHLGEGEATPSPLPVGASRAEGRYQVLGEIARGGVGVVYRGHDVDLGRDVAMKVIRPEHGKNDEVVQRFVEEAQIGGQLQHPGIVPVYEIGLDKEGKPYFTMKLVKGRTLSALIEEASDEQRGGRAHVRIFEAVCQTMAYAHARGVIHRDLKPSNVMTGAFGEVLVVDWGMGKVLRRGGTADEKRARQKDFDKSIIETFRSDGSGSESVVGSVLGTPRYMPPEQARGDIDAVDERSDVFSLGAVLCELLTGKAPYQGKGHEALFQAAKAELEGASERLDACGADPVLVELAKDCMAPAPAARPQHAGAVNERVGRYLATLDTRAREARVAAVEAKAQAVQERKRRRTSLALAASVLALVAVGGGGWLWWQSAAGTRARAAEQRVAIALAEVTEAHGTAEGGAGLQGYASAFDALRAAEVLARAPDVSAAAARRVAEARAALEASRDAAQAVADAKAHEVAMVARLQAIRGHLAVGDELADSVEAYARAFRDYGIDPIAQDGEALRAALDASPIRPQLLEHLYVWAQIVAQVQRGIPASAPPRQAHEQRAAGEHAPLLKKLHALERDPWVARLNAATTPQDLLALADHDGLYEKPTLHVLRLGQALLGAAEDARALAVLSELARRHPAEPGVQDALRALHFHGRPRRLGEAIRHASAAAALRPDSPSALLRLAWALKDSGRNGEALGLIERARTLAPKSRRIRANLANSLAITGRGAEALALADALLAEDPSYVYGRLARASALRALGRYEEALPICEAFVKAQPRNPEGLFMLAGLLRRLGRLAETKAVAERLLALEPESPYARRLMGRLAMMRGAFAEARAWFQKAIAVESEGLRAAKLRGDLTQLLYAMGEYQAALEVAEEALDQFATFDATGPARVEHAKAWRVAGLAHQGLQAWDEALAAFDKAASIAPEGAHALVNRASLLLYLGRIAEVRTTLATLREKHPDDPAVPRIEADLLIREGDPAAALAAMDRAIARDGRSFPTRIRRAGMRARLGDLHGALEDADRARTMRPESATVAHTRAGILLGLGRITEALAAADRAVSRDAKEIKGLVERVQPLAFLGRPDEAQAALEHVKRLLPRLPPVERAKEASLIGPLEAVIAAARRFPTYREKPLTEYSGRELAVFVRSHLARGEAQAALALVQRIVAGVPGSADAPAVLELGAVAAAAVHQEALALPWLARVCDRWRVQLGSADPVTALKARGRLRGYLRDERLAAVRDDDALAQLPAPRRAAWQGFWKKVRHVIGD